MVCVGGSMDRDRDTGRLFGAHGVSWCVGGIMGFRLCPYCVFQLCFAGTLGDTQNQGQHQSDGETKGGQTEWAGETDG